MKIKIGDITIEQTITGQIFLSTNSVQSVEVKDPKILSKALEGYILGEISNEK